MLPLLNKQDSHTITEIFWCPLDPFIAMENRGIICLLELPKVVPCNAQLLYLYKATTLVRNIPRSLVVVGRGGVVIPPEGEVLRHRTIDLALRREIREHFADHVGVVGKRAGETGTLLARREGNDSLIEHNAYISTFLRGSCRIATHPFKGQVAAHRHDVADLV